MLENLLNSWKLSGALHKVQLPLLVKKSTFDPNISVADTQNPNNTSCTICEVKYYCKKYYQQHMEKSHSNGSNTPLKISRRKEILDSKILPNPDDPNYYCASCQKKISSRSTYRSHIGIFQLNVGLNLRKLSVRLSGRKWMLGIVKIKDPPYVKKILVQGAPI